MAAIARRLEELRQRIAAARRLTVLTGAGVSAASGVPTFRGPSGLWRSFRPEQLATPEAFRRDPRLVWEWYAWRRGLIARCEPNAGHRVIARWSASPGFTLVTQNVDGLHERAGTRGVIRYHGSIWRLRCAADCAVHSAAECTEHTDVAAAECTEHMDVAAAEYTEHTDVVAAECTEHTDPVAAEYTEHTDVAAAEYTEYTDVAAAEYTEYTEWEDVRVPLDPLPPHCPSCGGLARPAVVWFGEPIPPHVSAAALEATRCDVFLSIGTSGVVYPAAGLIAEARVRGAFTAEINPKETSAAVDLSIVMHAEEALPRLAI